MNKFNITYLLVILILNSILGCGTSKQAQKDIHQLRKTVDRERAFDHFVNGSIYEQQGDYANAILEYQDALRYDSDPAIYYALSKSYAALGKLESAIEAINSAIKLAPNKKEYLSHLAELYINQGNLEGCIDTYNKILKVDSLDYRSWINIARIYQITLNYQKAIDTYNQILKRFGNNIEVLSQLSFLYSQQKKTDESIKLLRQALEIEPGNVDFKKQLASLYLSMEYFDSAKTIYEDIIEQLPTDIESRAALSHIFLIKQDYENAVQQFEFILKGELIPLESQLKYAQLFASFIQKDSAVAPYAIQLFEKIKIQSPEDWRSYFFIGIISSGMKENDRAISNFEEALKLEKNNPDLWVFLASIYFERRDYRKVLNVLNESLNHIEDELRVYLLIGLSYQRIDVLDSAAIALEKAYQIDQKNLDVITALALVYDDLKNYEESDSLYEKGLRLYPNNHLLLNNYAYSLSVRALNLEKALKMAQEAIRQQPKNPSYLDTYGWVHYQLGNYHDALKYIKAAVDEGEVSSVVLEHLGDVYFKLGHIDNAKKYWQEAYEKDLNNENLKKKIEKGSL